MPADPVVKFPYSLTDLSWNSDHTRNEQDTYCYCGRGYDPGIPMVQCRQCLQYFHRDCVKCFPKTLLFGDIFLEFTCSVCTQQEETYVRQSMAWITVVQLVLYNLMRRQDPDTDYPTDRDHHYFRWKEDLCAFIDDYWDYLNPGKQKSATWHNTIASVLSTNSSIFLSGFEKFQQPAWWTLQRYAPPSKIISKVKQGKAANVAKGKRKSEETPTEKRAYRKRATQVIPDVPPADPDAADDFLPSKPIRKRKAVHKSQPKSKKISKVTEAKGNGMILSDLSDLSSEEELSNPYSDTEPTMKSLEQFEPSKDLMESPNHDKVDAKLSSSVNTAVNPLENEANEPLTTGRTRSAIRKEIEVNLESQISDTFRDMLATSEQQHEILSQPKKMRTIRQSHGLELMSQQCEWSILQKLDRTGCVLPHDVARLRRKLHLRRLKRSQGAKVFDMDSYMNSHFRSHQRLSEIPEISFKPTVSRSTPSETKTMQAAGDAEKLKDIVQTPYVNSFASRLYGKPRCRSTITKAEPWLSSWNGRKLRPYIRRDFESKPPGMLLLHEIKRAAGKPRKLKDAGGLALEELDVESIDYVYFQKEHLEQVNRVLCRSFWDGIDVSENLLFPEFSIVALYKRYVVGCAFMTPEAYVTYITVVPGWEKAGIGQFLLYHLFQTAISKDITLHVSANSPAMILYQKFGFKPEEFIINFYDKYLSPDSSYSKNAFYLRLRR